MFLLKLDYSIALNSWAHFISNVISFVYLKVMFARSVSRCSTSVVLGILWFFCPRWHAKNIGVLCVVKGEGDSLYSVLVCFQSCWSNACDIGSRKSILRGRLGGQAAPVYGVYSPQFSKVLLMIMNSQHISVVLFVCRVCTSFALWSPFCRNHNGRVFFCSSSALGYKSWWFHKTIGGYMRMSCMTSIWSKNWTKNPYQSWLL